VTVFDLVPKDFWPRYYTTQAAIGFRNMTNDTNVLRITDKQGNWESITTTDVFSYVLGYADSGEISSGVYQGYWAIIWT